MPVYFAAPGIGRQGVVAGFVLSAPDYAGVPEPAVGSVSWAFAVADITVSGQTVHIATGYQHWVNIGGVVYAYVQQNSDTAAVVAAYLRDSINGAADAMATATASGGTLTLAPRQNTGAAIPVTASTSAAPNNIQQWLFELTGNELVPAISRGCLFAQSTMYVPATAPVLPAAPASQQSWLFWNSGTGWYWGSTPTPTTSDDACVGWVVTNATGVIAFSSRRIGTGVEAAIAPGAPGVVAIGGAGDTGVPAAVTFQVLETATQLEIGDLVLASADNAAGIDYAEFILYYVDGTETPLTLTAAAGSGDTSLTASGALPASVPGSVTFTFYAATTGGITIGPGYVHSIGIGAVTYRYVQQVEDTAAMIAQALADVIDADADANAEATAVGSTVVLAPLQDTAANVTCSASDGNTVQTLVETMPSYVVIDSEIVEVKAADGSVVVRGQKGSTAAAHANGAQVWPVKAMTVVFAIPPLTYGTPAWPTVVGQIPFAAKALVAADAWVLNEIGPSPVTTECFAGVGPYGVDSLGNPLAADVAAFTATVTVGIAIAGQPYYQFSGTVKTGLDADQAEIDIAITDASGAVSIAQKLQGPFAANTTYNWQSLVAPQPTSGPSLVFSAKPVPLNVDLAPTVSAYGVTGLTVPNGITSVLPPTPASAVTSITAGDASALVTTDPKYKARYADSTRSVHAPIWMVPVVSALPAVINVFVNQGDGRGWNPWASFTLTAVGEVVYLPGDAWVPSANQSWEIAAMGGVYAGSGQFLSALPGSACAPASFTLYKSSLPLATDVVAVAIPAGTATANPYNAVRSDGTQYFSIGPTATYDDTGCVGDSNARFVRWTAQPYDGSAVAIGPEVPWGGTQVSAAGETQDIYDGPYGPLAGDYGPSGAAGYPTTQICFERLRCYVCNANNLTAQSFQDATCATLETGLKLNGVGTAADHVDITVAVAGAPPTGKINANRLDDMTLGNGVKRSAGKLLVATGPSLTFDGSGNTILSTGNLSNMLFNPDFENGLTAWPVQGGTVSTVTNPTLAYTGQSFLVLYDGSFSGVLQQVPCQPGQEFVVKIPANHGGAVTSGLYLAVGFMDSSGANISGSGQGLVIPAASAPSVWTVETLPLATAPSNASYVYVSLSCQGGTAGGDSWWIDNVVLRLQTPAGSGVQPDGNSGLALNYGAAVADDGTGKITILTNGPVYKDISGKLNLNLSTDFVVSGGVLNQNAVNLAKAYGFNTTNFSTSGGAFVVNQIGVNTLIAGNTFNLGTSVFAASASGPAVEIAASGLTMVDNYTTPANLLTIASTGLSLVHGANSLTVTASGVGIYGPSGSLTATSGGIVITNGGSSVTVTPSSVAIVQGTLSLNLNGVTTMVANLYDSHLSGYAGLKSTDNATGNYCVAYPEAFYLYGATLGGQCVLIDTSAGAYGRVDLFGSGGANALLHCPGGDAKLYLGASGGGSISLDASASSVAIGGNQVLSTRVATTPATLADVIAVLQHHGLSN